MTSIRSGASHDRHHTRNPHRTRLASAGRKETPLVEILCDLKYWAEADNLDFITKANEAEALYEKEQKAIVAVPVPHRVKFTVYEHYSTEIVALTPEEAVEVAQKLYATEGPSPAHGFVLTDSDNCYWSADEVQS